MTQPQAKPVGEVVLSGPGSVDDQLVESLGIHLGLPTTVAGAARHARPARRSRAARIRTAYTVAAGLAMGRAA